MTAPSKTFSVPTDAEIDVDSPLTETLFTQIRDSLVHLEEWLGGSYTAAVNHNHDGVNSASLDVESDTLRNGSFEVNSTDGWDEVLATGGTIATGTAGAMDGKYCAAITSTVAANGGGTLTSSGAVDCTGGQLKQFRLMFQASAINVSSSATALWFDADLAQISESTIYTTTNTPTTPRLCVRRIAAPANARFVKIKLATQLGSTGAGTVYFDGVSIEQAAMLGGEEIITASGTFSAIWGDVEVELVNAGDDAPGDGGSGGAYSRGTLTTSSDITVTVGTVVTGNGTPSVFSTMTGGSGGSINIAAQPGTTGFSAGVTYFVGGHGGSSPLGMGGVPGAYGSVSAGTSGTGYGSGGGGGSGTIDPAVVGANGIGTQGLVIVRW
jgi:hypothetical protein